MSLFPIIFLSLVLMLIADVLRWKIVVGRELKRRELVRIGTVGMRITPAKGFRFIEACICQRSGKEFRVVILNRGWLRTRPSIDVVEV